VKWHRYATAHLSLCTVKWHRYATAHLSLCTVKWRRYATAHLSLCTVKWRRYATAHLSLCTVKWRRYAVVSVATYPNSWTPNCPHRKGTSIKGIRDILFAVARFLSTLHSLCRAPLQYSVRHYVNAKSTKWLSFLRDQLWIACVPTGETNVQHWFLSRLRVIFSFVLSQIRKNIHQYDNPIMRT